MTDLYQYEHELNSRGFTFPVKIRDISKFERLNPGLSGINVFSVNESKKFYPLRMALRDPHKTMDVFLYEEDGQPHYSLIKNFSRLFHSQITSRTNEPIHISERCFTHFTKEDLLLKHTAVVRGATTVQTDQKAGFGSRGTNGAISMQQVVM